MAKAKQNKKNKTSWKEGQSGNPNGRPKGTVSLTTQIKEVAKWWAPEKMMKEYRVFFPDLPAKMTMVQLLALRGWCKALDIKHGDVMAKEIAERIDGKVPFPLTGTPDGDPINVKHDLSGLSLKELTLLDRLTGKCETPDE